MLLKFKLADNNIECSQGGILRLLTSNEHIGMTEVYAFNELKDGTLILKARFDNAENARNFINMAHNNEKIKLLTSDLFYQENFSDSAEYIDHKL